MAGNWEKEAAALQEARQQLLKQRSSKSSSLESGVSMRESVTDLSFADNHPADLGSENFERSKDLSLQEHSYGRLRLIDEALARIEKGTYGVCQRCGERISRERLEAVPEAPYCLPCREYEERSSGDLNRRPAEEDLLRPPYSRSIVFGDPGLDREDFWQEVARHNKRPRIFEDALEDEETGLVEDVDALTNEEFRDQLPE